MFYAEKEKYRSKEARTLYFFVSVALFVLRAWCMFCLMRMLNAGHLTLPAACTYLCAMSCIQFMVLSFFDNKYAEHSVFYYWKSVLLCGSIKAVQLYLWLAALSSCGPFIYVLFEQSPKVLFVAVGLVANSYSDNRFLYIIGILITLGGYMISLFGLPKLPIEIPEMVYKSLNDLRLVETTQPLKGVVCVVVSSFLNIFYNYITHQISHVNGKRYALQFNCYLVSCITCLSYCYFKHQPITIPQSREIVNLLICSFACVVSMFYMHSMSNRSISERFTTKLGYYTSLISVIALEYLQKQSTLNNAVLICSVVISIGLWFLNIPVKKSKKTVKKGSSVLRFFRFVFTSKPSRKIFLYLSINLAFMFVELIVGLWNNSLGLISDAGHMLFDSSALIIGLIASYVAQWPSNKSYSFGYKRVEVLSGYVNGVFLVFVGLSVAAECVERLRDPPEVGDNQLMATSVGGLVVNLIGLVFFHDIGHAGHDHGHGHSHGEHGHEGHEHNDNMRGVFLHVLADTLGSVGVIISTFLMQRYNMWIADPICAFIISLLILLSVFPLVSHSSRVLLNSIPEGKEELWKSVQEVVCGMSGVRGIASPQFFIYTGESYVCSLRVLVADGKEKEVLRNVKELLEQVGIYDSTIDVTTRGSEEFYKVSSGLNANSIIQSFMGMSHHHHHHSDHHFKDHHSDDSDDHSHDHFSDDSHDHDDHDDHDHQHRISRKLLISSGKVD